MTKTILYLDQNFVSNLAKAENLLNWKDPDREFYRELLDLLRFRIRHDRLVCPTSPFHRQESDQSARVKGFVWHVVENLSHGLSFNGSTEIHCNQIAATAYSYCNLTKPDVPSWAVAFNRNPYESVKRLPKPPDIQVYLSSSKKLVDSGRTLDRVVADTYTNFKKSRSGKSHTVQEELQFQKLQLVEETFLPVGAIDPEILKKLADISQMESNACKTHHLR